MPLKETILTILLSIILVPPLFLAALMVVGLMIDGVAETRTEHDRCLKHATNGYEIRQCR